MRFELQCLNWSKFVDSKRFVKMSLLHKLCVICVPKYASICVKVKTIHPAGTQLKPSPKQPATGVSILN